MGKKSKKRQLEEEESGNSATHVSELNTNGNSKNEETAQQLFEKVESLLDSCNYEDAAECCQKILKLDPNNLDAMDLLGGIFSEIGSVDEAKSLWLRCIELAPEEGYKKYFGLAQVCEGKESLNYYQKGISLLKQQLEEIERVKSEPDSVVSNIKTVLSDGFCAIAELYMTDLCQEDKASDLCKVAIEESISYKPDNPDSYRILASFLIVENKLEEAKVAIKKNLDFWFHDYEAMCDNPDKDVESEVSVPDYITRIEIGKILIELQMFTEATTIFDGLIEEDDQVFIVWYLLGILYHSQGEEHYKTAFHYFQKAKEVAQKTGETDSDEVIHIDELLDALSQEKAVTSIDSDEDPPEVNELSSSSEDDEDMDS